MQNNDSAWGWWPLDSQVGSGLSPPRDANGQLGARRRSDPKMAPPQPPFRVAAPAPTVAAPGTSTATAPSPQHASTKLTAIATGNSGSARHDAGGSVSVSTATRLAVLPAGDQHTPQLSPLVTGGRAPTFPAAATAATTTATVASPARGALHGATASSGQGGSDVGLVAACASVDDDDSECLVSVQLPPAAVAAWSSAATADSASVSVSLTQPSTAITSSVLTHTCAVASPDPAAAPSASSSTADSTPSSTSRQGRQRHRDRGTRRHHGNSGGDRGNPSSTTSSFVSSTVDVSPLTTDPLTSPPASSGAGGGAQVLPPSSSSTAARRSSTHAGPPGLAMFPALTSANGSTASPVVRAHTAVSSTTPSYSAVASGVAVSGSGKAAVGKGRASVGGVSPTMGPYSVVPAGSGSSVVHALFPTTTSAPVAGGSGGSATAAAVAGSQGTSAVSGGRPEANGHDGDGAVGARRRDVRRDVSDHKLFTALEFTK